MPRLEDLPPDAIAAAVSRVVVDAIAVGGDTEEIVRRALDGARRALELDASSEAPPSAPATPAKSDMRPVVTEDDVLDAARNGAELRVPAGALVTPLARDTAKDRGVRLVEG